MSKEGFIFLHRKLEEWEWYDDANTMRLFIHCLLEANFVDKQWRGVSIKRGQFITSQPKLAHSLKLSVQQIRTALNKLKSTGEITVLTTADYSIITIKNYDDYQQNNSLNNNLATDKQQSNNSLITTTNNDKNDNNEKNIISLPEKKLDPFINPIKTFFVEEYQKVFKKTPRLSSFECNRLIELAKDNADIKELIPVALKRLKKIDFKDINYTPSANWLLKGNNFERVINGEFEPQKSDYEKLMEKYGGNNG